MLAIGGSLVLGWMRFRLVWMACIAAAYAGLNIWVQFDRVVPWKRAAGIATGSEEDIIIGAIVGSFLTVAVCYGIGRMCRAWLKPDRARPPSDNPLI